MGLLGDIGKSLNNLGKKANEVINNGKEAISDALSGNSSEDGDSSGKGEHSGSGEDTKPSSSPEVAPKEEAPKEEAPKEEMPKEEIPKEEVPKEEIPKEEVPKQDMSTTTSSLQDPLTSFGPGSIFSNFGNNQSSMGSTGSIFSTEFLNSFRPTVLDQVIDSWGTGFDLPFMGSSNMYNMGNMGMGLPPSNLYSYNPNNAFGLL